MAQEELFAPAIRSEIENRIEAFNQKYLTKKAVDIMQKSKVNLFISCEN